MQQNAAKIEAMTNASMGPSSGDDGEDIGENIDSIAEQLASMGPSSGDDGEVHGCPGRSRNSARLQWGRHQVMTERRKGKSGVRMGQNASMGPSSGDDGETSVPV